MTIISKSVEINKPLDDVKAFLDQTNRIPDWYEGIESVDPDPNYPLEVGSSCGMVAKSAGVTVESKFTLKKRESHLMEFEFDGMMSGTNSWTFRESGDVTHLDLVVDYELSGGILGKIMDRLFVERTYDANSETSLQNLKLMIEA
ncbi:MAG: SRPBCC family protein [Chloroflexota bacterium]